MASVALSRSFVVLQSKRTIALITQSLPFKTKLLSSLSDLHNDQINHQHRLLRSPVSPNRCRSRAPTCFEYVISLPCPKGQATVQLYLEDSKKLFFRNSQRIRSHFRLLKIPREWALARLLGSCEKLNTMSIHVGFHPFSPCEDPTRSKQDPTTQHVRSNILA